MLVTNLTKDVHNADSVEQKQMQENTSSGHNCNLITQHWRIGPASVRAEARKQILAETHKLRFKLESASTV